MLREDWVQQPREREYTKRTRDDRTGSVSAVLVASTAMMNTTQQGLSHNHVIAKVQGTMIRGTRKIWRAWRRVLTIPMVGDAVASAFASVLSVVLSCDGVYLIHFLRCDHR